VGYINSLRGSASREIAVDDIARQVSKSDDSAVLIVGFFNSASDAAFETYEEASKMIFCIWTHLVLLPPARRSCVSVCHSVSSITEK